MTATVPYANGKAPDDFAKEDAIDRAFSEIDYSAIETRIMSWGIDRAVPGCDRTIYEMFYGAAPKMVVEKDAITGTIPEIKPSLDWATMFAMLEDATNRERRQDEALVKALIDGGFRVTISGMADHQMVAVLPARYQRAYDAVMEQRQRDKERRFMTMYGGNPIMHSGTMS